MNRVSLLVATSMSLVLTGCDCGSGGANSLKFEFGGLAGVAGEFRNGDVLVFAADRTHRMRLNFTSAPDVLPGIDCNWLRPAPDGTEFVSCANEYVRAPGQDWQRLLIPDEPSVFLGQAKDGTRYFQRTSKELLAQAPGEATFTPVNVPAGATLEFSPYGHFLLRLTNTMAALAGSQLGPEIPLPAYPLSATRPSFALGPLVDSSGHIYIATERWAFDRYDLTTGARDAAWFPPVNQDNPSFRFMGVDSAGSLFALSEKNQGSGHGQKDNTIAIGSVMKRGRGEAGWQEAVALFGNGYLLAEQHPVFWPGLDGRWWFSTCLANCAGLNGRAQFEIRRWQPTGFVDVPAVPKSYQAIQDVGFAIAAGDRRSELTFADAKCEVVPSADLFGVGYAVCHAPGTYTATLVTKADTGAVTSTRTVTVEVAPIPNLPVRKHRHSVIIDSSSGGWLYVGTDGLAHENAWTLPTPTDRVLPAPTGVIAVTLARNTPMILTRDGAVYALNVGNPTPTRLNVPPAKAINGTHMVGVDGKVYSLVDGALPLEKMSDIVSLTCRATYLQSGALHEYCAALNATGHMWRFEKVQATNGQVQDAGDHPLLGALNNGGSMSRDGRAYQQEMLTTDNTVWLGAHELIDFAGIMRTGTQSGIGAFNVPTTALVTKQGEAWLSAFDGLNTFGIRLPPGRTAIAIEPVLQGVLVWLDDRKVLFTPIPTVQVRGGPGGLAATPLAIQVAVPEL